jgi:hypothetical protein
MSYTVKTTMTKPAGTAWFSQANPEANTRLNNWVKARSGVISATSVDVDANTIDHFLTCDTKASYDALVAAQATNADYQAKQAYRVAQKQVGTTTVV